MSRFQQHLIKCKKNKSSTKIMCPYDGSEFILPEKMAEHQLTCNKRHLVLMPTDSIGNECTNVNRPPLDKFIPPTSNEEGWNSDEEYVSKDYKTAIEMSRKLAENNSRMQPFYENAFGSVTGVGRGSYLASLSSSSSCVRRSNPALSPSVSKTQRKVPLIEEKKEEHNEEGVYDDVDDDDDDDDDDGSVFESESSFRKHYTDIKLSTRQQKDNSEKLQCTQQYKSLNSSLEKTQTKEQEEKCEKKNKTLDEGSTGSTRSGEADDIARANKLVAKRSFGRGITPFVLEMLAKSVSQESKQSTSLAGNIEDLSITDFDKHLDGVTFQPSISQKSHSNEKVVKDRCSSPNIGESCDRIVSMNGFGRGISPYSLDDKK